MSKAGIRDQISFGHTNLSELRHMLFTVLDRLQSAQPAVAILTVGTLFKLMCEGTGLRTTNVLEHLGRMEGDLESPFTIHVQAIRKFIEGEWNDT